jgi:hypothetical protein
MWRCVVKLNVNDAYLLKTIKPYYFINTGGTFASYVFTGEEVEFDQGAMLTLRITPRTLPTTEQVIKMAWLNRMLSQIRGSLYLVRTAATTLGIEYPGELHTLGHP